MKITSLLFAVFLLLPAQLFAVGPPAGSVGSVQIKKDSQNFGALSTDTLASYTAHNTVMNGLAYDPRDPKYGAICGGFNTFAGDGSTRTFTYTIPFTGATTTDNANFMVFYEPTNGSGSATILGPTAFSVTGVNSGSGGTITLNTAPPAANTLIVVHDDSAGFTAASVDATASGGYISVPDECTIYGSQSLGTQLSEGAQLIGQGFTPNYTFQGTGSRPIMRVIAPTGAAPNFGINVSGKTQQFFEGFEITPHVPGANALAFLTVPVLIGANGAGGAGGGTSPGIVAQYMTFNEGIVGFGAPIGGNSAYIFSVLRFNNFTANTAGIYGPLSDAVIAGNNFNSNGAFGAYGAAGGMVVGPNEGAPGAAGASRVESNRFEYNSEGVVIKSGTLINFDGNQFDGNAACGINLNTFWSKINITGGWFRYNANAGAGGVGTTTAGKDAHICFNGGAASGSGGLYVSNVIFTNGYAQGYTAALGSANANTPPYVLDFNTAAADNNNVQIVGGTAENIAGVNGASVTDFVIYRNGVPTNIKLDINGQPVYGKNANGNNPALVRGIPTLQATSVIAYGDHNTLAPNTPPPGSDYGTLISMDMNAGYTNNGVDRTYTCDSLDAGLIYQQAPVNYGNSLYLFLPSIGDPAYGGGGSTTHLTDVNNCYKAALSWVTVPTQFKVTGQNAACVQAGTWVNDTAFGGSLGVTSHTNASTLTCTITNYGAPLYAWYRVHDSDGGTFTYSVDGGTAVSVNTAPLASPTGDGLGDTFAEALIRVPYVNAGSHTIAFTVTSSTSSSNNVYILGVGTPSNLPYYGGGPTIFAAGMPYAKNNTDAATSLAYDAAFKSTVALLQQDGLNANFADVKKYMNFTTDLTSSQILSISGEVHVKDAFEAQMQFTKTPSSGAGVVDPRNYGAACNSKNFINTFGSPDNSVSTTNGSAVISINGYTFVDGIATQTGGGDVGKVISVFGGGFGAATNDVGPTTYILSVNTSNNTATLGRNMVLTASTGFAVMGGYPTNPADPSTAADDTLYIQNAATAAVASGSKVFLPNKCLVHNMQLPNGTLLEGSMGGVDYGSAVTSLAPTTVLYCASNGYAEDPHLCINIANSQNVRLKDFQMQCSIFPFMGYSGITLAGIGSESNTYLANEGVMLDHVSHFMCPVQFGVPFASNIPVTFTASIAGTAMTVSAITSTNVASSYPRTFIASDWLGVGRAVTGAGVTAGTKIVSSAIAGGVGTYTLNNSMTIASQTMTSPAAAVFLSGSIRNNQFAGGGIGINGDFSDLQDIGSVFTGNFYTCLYLGPNTGGATGNGANRFSLERFEECNAGAIVLDGTNADQFTGVHFQFNNGYAIETKNAWDNITITGGTLQGNGWDSGQASTTAQIGLGGTGTNFSLNSVEWLKTNFAWPGNPTSPYLISTRVGSSVDYVSIEGGDAKDGFSTAVVNWAGNTPSHYKQVVTALPYIDSTQSVLSASTVGSIGMGTISPSANAALDIGSKTNAIILPTGTTGQRPTPTAGMIRFNSTIPQFEGYDGSGWTSFGTAGGAPAISSCGSGALVTGSTDHKGQVSGITVATGCTITFSAALSAAPSCQFNTNAGIVPTIASISTTAVTTSMAALTGTLYYICF